MKAPFSARLAQEIERLGGQAVPPERGGTALAWWGAIEWPLGARFPNRDRQDVPDAFDPRGGSALEGEVAVGADSGQFLYVADAGDASDDPTVYRVDHGSPRERDRGEPLSRILARFELERAEAPDVVVPDENLRRRLDAHGVQLTAAKLARLDQLNASRSQIASIEGLQHARALEVLDLSGNQITRLAPLAGLVRLRSLSLQDNPATDLSPLAGLRALQRLTVSAGPDLGPLAGLDRVTELELTGGRSDLGPLAGMTALRVLDLGGAGSSLPTLPALPITELRLNDVADLAPVARLPRLETLHIYKDVALADLSPLAAVTSLKKLELVGASVTDVTPLARLPALEHLDLRMAPFDDYAALLPMPALRLVMVNGGPGEEALLALERRGVQVIRYVGAGSRPRRQG